MVAEIVVGLTTLFLYTNNIIGWKTLAVLVWIFYWLPKFIFVSGITTLYPSILMRNAASLTNVALTFDDVPYGDSFCDLLNVLDKYGAKVTFFVISDYVNEQNKKYLIRAIRDGHQLANHGKSNSLHAIKSSKDLKKEIDTCDAILKELYREANVELPKTMIYRPGCGLFTKQMIDTVEEKGYRIALGSVYPNDTFMMVKWINYFYVTRHIWAGDIVIMHDRKWTPGTLELLLPWLKKNNYKCSTIDDLF